MRIGHFEPAAVILQDAGVADLAAGLAVEGGAVEDDGGILACADRLAQFVAADDAEDVALDLVHRVAHEVRHAAALLQLGHRAAAEDVGAELGALARELALMLHLALEAFAVHL